MIQELCIDGDEYHEKPWSSHIIISAIRGNDEEYNLTVLILDLLSLFREFQKTHYKSGRSHLEKYNDKTYNLCTRFQKSYATYGFVLNFRMNMIISNGIALCKHIQKRLYCYDRACKTRERQAGHVFGDFKETLSPKLVQALLVYLKQSYPGKYNDIKGIKEFIISQLEEKGVAIDCSLICDFIEHGLKPDRFCKEFDVSLYENGKRLTTQDIRDKIVKAVEKKSTLYEKRGGFARGLPLSIEGHIKEFL